MEHSRPNTTIITRLQVLRRGRSFHYVVRKLFVSPSGQKSEKVQLKIS